MCVSRRMTSSSGGLLRAQGYAPIPKSVSKKRILGNIDLFDFELSQQEVEELHSLNEGASHVVKVANRQWVIRYPLTSLHMVDLITDWDVTECP